MKNYELASTQMNIWEMQKMYPDTPIGNVCGTLTVKETEFNDLMWKKTLNTFIRNNDALRMIVESNQNHLTQSIADFVEQDYEVVDFSSKSIEEIEDLYEQWTNKPFGKNESLVDFKILKFNDYESGFYVRASHMVCDAFSMGLLAQQISKIYTNLIKNPEYTEDEKASYTLYLDREKKYLESEKFVDDKNFWINEYLEEPLVTSLAPNATNSVAAKRLSKTLNEDLTHRIKSFCSENNVFPAVFFESLIFAYMKRLTGEDKITIGSPLLTRSGRAEREIMGMFINALPFNLDIDNEGTFDSLCSNVSAKKSQLFKHVNYFTQFIDA